MSVRHSSGSLYGRRRAGTNTATNGRGHGSPVSRLSTSAVPEEFSGSPSNRNSGTFVDLRPHSYADPDVQSDRSSIISSSSVSTISSVNITHTSSTGLAPSIDPAHSSGSLNTQASSSSLSDKATPSHHLAATQRMNAHTDPQRVARAPSPLLTTSAFPGNSRETELQSSSSSVEGMSLESSGSAPSLILNTPM